MTWTVAAADFNEAVEKAAEFLSERTNPNRPWAETTDPERQLYLDDALCAVGIAFPIICGPFAAENRRLRQELDHTRRAAEAVEHLKWDEARYEQALEREKCLESQVEMLKAGFRCVEPCSCLTHCPAHEDQPECDPPCCYAAAVRQRDEALADERRLIREIESGELA